MRLALLRALVLVCCGVLTMPPGWCCVLGAGQCCEKAAPPVETADVEACCCCPQPVKQEHAPKAPAPIPAKKSPCCEAKPTTLAKSSYDLAFLVPIHDVVIETDLA